MATTTTNLGLTKPALSESADVGVINDNSDKIDAEAGKARANLAATYSASSSYAVGDYCERGGNLYRCTTAIGSGGEAWNASHWTQVTATGETKSLSSKIGNIHNVGTVASVSDLMTLINQTENGLYVTVKAATTLMNALVGVSRGGVVTAFRGTSSSTWIEFMAIDTSSVFYAGAYDTSNNVVASLKSWYKYEIYTETASTSAGGNLSVTLPTAGIIVSAWTSSSDRLCIPYPANAATADGKQTWYIKVLKQSDLSIVASTSMTYYVLYYVPQA